MLHVLYLTGSPATGKSSLIARLRARRTSLQVFSYGEELTHLVQSRRQGFSQSDLRASPASYVTPQDVVDTDERLIAFVNQHRNVTDVVIDTHAVTKEAYGFRVTAFSADYLLRVRPTRLVCLYAAANTICDRLSADPAGRPEISEFEATMHNELQSSLVATYAVLLGLPVYYLDGSVAPALLDERIDRLLAG